MKVGGKEWTSSAWEPDPLVLNRGRDKDGKPQFLVFRARGIKNYDEFTRLCPKPKNHSGYLTPSGWKEDPKSPQYLDQLELWKQRRWAYTVIKTLEPSEIEWDKVQLSNPKTWLHYEAELLQIVNHCEQGLVIDLVHTANALDQEKLEENRQSFFQQLEQSPSDQTGQSSDQGKPTSGELVSEQVCSHQE